MPPVSPDAVVAGGFRVASAVPGRIRLRATDGEGRRSLAAVADELRSSAEVMAADVRTRSASLVVRFDPVHASDVADRLGALGVDLRIGVPDAPPDPATTVVGAAAAAANRAVGRRLDGTDLRALVPLGLGLMAARRAMRGEERLADAPWYVLAWYASQTFWKFHGDGTVARGAAAAGEGG